MSCAAVMRPSSMFAAQEAIGVFKGDDEGLVEQLVKACQGAYQPKGPLRERELVPWVDDSIDCSALQQPLESGSRRASVNAARTVSTKQALIRHTPESPEYKKANAKRSKAGFSNGRSVSPKVQHAISSGGTAAGFPFACPALLASPKPSSLPMPTTGLLSRAGNRSRSPSPPKASDISVPYFVPLLQQVGPIAA